MRWWHSWKHFAQGVVGTAYLKGSSQALPEIRLKGCCGLLLVHHEQVPGKYVVLPWCYRHGFGCGIDVYSSADDKPGRI